MLVVATTLVRDAKSNCGWMCVAERSATLVTSPKRRGSIRGFGPWLETPLPAGSFCPPPAGAGAGPDLMCATHPSPSLVIHPVCRGAWLILVLQAEPKGAGPEGGVART